MPISQENLSQRSESVDPSLASGADASCRPDQLFGWWAVETRRFTRMFGVAKGADLTALRKEARKARKEAALSGIEQPLYGLTGDGIALVEVTGPMTKYSTSFQALLGGTSTLRTRQALRAAARNPEVLGIMVLFDSRGGTIGGTADLADEIRAADARKPMYTYAQGLMASAALWRAALVASSSRRRRRMSGRRQRRRRPDGGPWRLLSRSCVRPRGLASASPRLLAMPVSWWTARGSNPRPPDCERGGGYRRRDRPS